MNEASPPIAVDPSPGVRPRLDAPADPGVVARGAERLRALRGWARWLLVTQRGAWIGGLVMMVLIGAGLVDYVLRTPAWMRVLAWVVGAGILGGALWRHLWPALRFRPDLESLALRVERTPAGQQAGLGGILASGVGLRERAHDDDLGGRLAARVSTAAARGLEGLSPLSVLDFRPAARAALVCLVLLMGTLALVIVQPTLSAIGARRVLLPWSGAAWPLRSQLADATSTRFHALGTALPIRAGLVRSPDHAPAALVEVHYRLLTGGRSPGVRSVALNLQSTPIRVNTTGLDGQPLSAEVPLFAQDLPASALAPVEGQPPADELEYWLTSGDAQTTPARVRLVQPPSVLSATALVTPPPYWPGPASTHELGSGVDERAVLTGVLSGSSVTLTLTLNKPVPVPAPGTPERGAWVASALGLPAPGVEVDAGSAERSDRLSVRFTAAESTRIPVRLVDEFGIASSDDAAYRVQTIEDRPPEATVTRPESDVEVLATAKVDLTIEGRDDLALKSLAAQFQLARRPIGSAGAPADAPTAEPADLQRREFALAAGQGTTQAAINLSIVPGDLAAQAGDELWITALASDVYAAGGVGRAGVRSGVRKIRVISSDQLIEQSWNELLSLRRAAMRTSEQQTAARERAGKANERLASMKGDAAAEAKAEAAREGVSELDNVLREQRSVGQTLARMNEAAQRLGERLQQNALEDREVQQALSDAKRLINEAADAAQQAGQQAEQARGEAGQAQQAQEAGAADEAQQAAERARRGAEQSAAQQQKVERALEELARKLDRGQDAWAVRRTLDRLAEEQKALRERVQEAAKNTAGKGREDLSPEQRQQGDQNAAQQEQMAQRLNQLQQQMQEAARNLERNEPTTAKALQEAARRAQRSQAAQQMQQAAEQIRQNQQDSAARQQEQIEETLKQMQQDLQQAAKQRDAVLKRQLESLIETIRGLVVRQEIALRNLRGGAGNLDTELITLNTSTLDAAENARSAGREALAAARHLSSAGEAQGEAIGHLRATPPAGPSADASEERALASLRSALDEAQKALNKAENREQDQKRDELRAQYAALLSEQRALITATGPMVGKPVDRRTRIVAGDLRTRQSAIHTQAAKLLAGNPDLTSSPTFPLAHRRIEGASTQAAEMLGKPELTAGLVARQETVARTLESLITALASSQPDDDPFRTPEESGGEQGGQGQQQPPGLIPSAAEVALLKALQEEALAATRRASETPDAALAKLNAEDAQRLQSELPRIADEIVKKIEQESSGGGPAPIKPGEPEQPAKPDQPPQPAGGGEG